MLIARWLASGLAAWIVVLVLPTEIGAQGRHFPEDDDLRTILRYLVEDTPVAGIVLGVLEADGTTRVVSHGTGGAGAPPLGPDAVFEIGSITKTFTGTLLADLVERGVVELDDPVQRYLPDSVNLPTWGEQEITLLDLATHRSGLPRAVTNHAPADRDDPYADYTLTVMSDFLNGHELRRPPGEEYEYSNLGYQLLAHAIGHASGRPFSELVRERMLEPLGMLGTAYALDEVADRMVRGHDELAPAGFSNSLEVSRGAGGLRSSAADMLRYLEANIGPANGDVERWLRSAHVPRAQREAGGAQTGLAWVTREIGGRALVEHGGGTLGFTTHLAFDPEREVGYILLTNSRLFADPTAAELLAFGAPLDYPVVAPPKQILADVVGAYALDADRTLFVRLEPEGYLTLQQSGRARARLYPSSDSTYFSRQQPIVFTARRDEGGDVVGLALDRDDRDDAFAERVGDEVPDPRAVRRGSVWLAVSTEWGVIRRLALAAGLLTLLAIAVFALLSRRASRSRT